jgi:ferrochelatase
MSDKPQDGVALINLGSPDSPSPADVRRYLDEFLMDGRVLDLPYPVRRLVVSLFILPSRPKRSAEAYEAIWWPEGSPLVVISRQVQQQLQARMEIPISLGMRYGRPSMAQCLEELNGQGVHRVLLLPMYPHYAMSTYETVLEEAHRLIAQGGLDLELQVLPPFYQHPDYIRTLAASANPYLAKGFDHLLFSYHGIPERHLKKSDPTCSHCLRSPDCCSIPSPAHATCYRHQVITTTRLFIAETGLPPAKTSLAFQSRLGADTWLQPFTDAELVRLAESGVKKLLVICPAFISDCLETLEEIGLRGKDLFLNAGGTEFELIPCLNDHPLWIETLHNWIQQEFSLQTASIKSNPS